MYIIIEAMSDLVINKLSHCNAPVAGGMGMILLCEKVAKEDIQIRFFEEKDGRVTWEGFGDFQPSQVHKQVQNIAFVVIVKFIFFSITKEFIIIRRQSRFERLVTVHKK